MGYLNIRDFCEDILRGYEIKEDKPVPVVLASGLPDYRIYTDKKRLMQVITNFINNALKFTSKGQITLEYHFKEGTNEIEFSVTDTGIGIAPDAVGQVFDRFVKLPEYRGAPWWHDWRRIGNRGRESFLVYASLCGIGLIME